MKILRTVKFFSLLVIVMMMFPILTQGSQTVETQGSQTVETQGSQAVETQDSQAVETQDSQTVETQDSQTVETQVSQTTKMTELQLFAEFESLDSILSKKINVSTLKPLISREVPSIVSIITRDEIVNTGARDLIDILSLIPSFGVNLDINNVTMLNVRGVPFTEGRILLLIDGQQITDNLYGALPLRNRIPIEHIQQIEVIRGPGSAIYGGTAECAVINIKTRSGEEIDGVHVAGSYGLIKNTYGHRRVSLSFGKEIDGLDLRIHFLGGQGNRSGEDYTSFYGSSYNLTNHQQQNPLHFNFGGSYKGLEFTFLADLFRQTMRDWWGANLPDDVNGFYELYSYDAKYKWQINEKLTITPRITRREENSWYRAGEGTLDIQPETYTVYRDVRQESPSYRTTEEVVASYDFTDTTNLLVGINAWQETTEFVQIPFRFKLHNVAYFTQLLTDIAGFNISAGARYEDNSWAKQSFVPRFGITKVIDRFHIKAMATQAFRSPTAFNLVQDDIKPYGVDERINPETMQSIEFETGYLLTKDMSLSLNYYNNLFENLLLWSGKINPNQPQVTTSGYSNWPGMRTAGVEAEYKFRQKWGFVNAAYAYTTLLWNGSAAHLGVTDMDDRSIGIPVHRASVNSVIKIMQDLTVNPSLVWFSDRYAYRSVGEPTEKIDDGALLLNLFVNYAVLKGLTIGVGCYDIMDVNPELTLNYANKHSPMKERGRELIGKVAYEMNF